MHGPGGKLHALVVVCMLSDCEHAMQCLLQVLKVVQSGTACMHLTYATNQRTTGPRAAKEQSTKLSKVSKHPS